MLRQFAANMPSLTSISYRDQRTLDEKAFSYLLRGCRNLRHVDVRGCRRLHGRCFRLLGLFLEEVSVRILYLVATTIGLGATRRL